MSNQSVLIVEDDKWLAEQYERVLRKEGYKVTISLHAQAAIEAIDKILPDAIIMDVLLTGSTAFTLLHELQSYSDTGEIPVILCTNLATELSLDDVKPYGVRQLLDKTTMLPDDLITTLKSVLL
jgi:CheY-like chemotaxis protein